MISGDINVRFSWDVTAMGLLNLKERALERVIDQRSEIMSLLNPLPSSRVLGEKERQQESNAEGGESRPPESKAEDVGGGVTEESPDEGKEEHKFSDILKESKKTSLEVTVLGAKGVTKVRNGLGQVGPSALSPFYIVCHLVFNLRKRILCIPKTCLWYRNSSSWFGFLDFDQAGWMSGVSTAGGMGGTIHAWPHIPNEEVRSRAVPFRPWPSCLPSCCRSLGDR
jgi:hypothetical protein